MTMTSKEKLITQVLTGFQNLRGKGSCYIFSNDVIPQLVYTMIERFTAKRPNAKIMIVHDNWSMRESIDNYLKAKGYDSTTTTYNIKMMSYGFVKPQFHYCYSLVITVGVNDNYDVLKHLSNENTFMLTILTENIMNNNFINAVRTILPSISTIDIAAELRSERISSLVEEHIVTVELSDEDKEKYKKANDYIAECVTVFDNLDNIAKCKQGDRQLNISAADFRNNIARENGWTETLDTSVPYLKQIDEIYNPNTLFEKACNFYNIAKSRRDLVTDNDAKLDKLIDILRENADKKILIVNKRGDYAKRVANYINLHYEKKCGEYHDCIDSAVAVDNNNNPILIKSGTNKGKPKILGSQAQSTLYEAMFNEGLISILSIKEKSDIKLKIACDLVIFTSSLCDNILDLKARFVNIKFTDSPTLVYVLCCNNTIETTKIYKSELPSNIKLIYDDTENFVSYDENSGDIIL